MSEIKTTSAERELQAAQAKLHDMSLHLVEASRAAEEWKLKCREANAYTDKAYAELDSWRLKAATAVGAASKLLDERDSLQARLALAVHHLTRLLDILGKCDQFDHHGYCQTHFIESPCRVAEAREALAQIAAPTPEDAAMDAAGLTKAPACRSCKGAGKVDPDGICGPRTATCQRCGGTGKMPAPVAPADEEPRIGRTLESKTAPVAPAVKSAATPWGYKLFAHMQSEHGLTLTLTELQEIVALAKETP
jgi:hypothetical protein